MRSFLVRKVNNFTKTQYLRAKVPNTYGTRLYKHICILIKIYLVSISAIHKNSISNQVGVVDGRANRVARLVTCNKDVHLRFLSPGAFI